MGKNNLSNYDWLNEPNQYEFKPLVFQFRAQEITYLYSKMINLFQGYFNKEFLLNITSSILGPWEINFLI